MYSNSRHPESTIAVFPVCLHATHACSTTWQYQCDHGFAGRQIAKHIGHEDSYDDDIYKESW
jgi:hypothetical protein